ncbi:S-layer homology domain-containing protein [Dysosmobacter sp.]|uniref:S-layer homology domain-containing protein n=1 Tax=Dysosmobacter sp. TaxID=2591382 RepID=UPI0026736B11|nr:S-layer homology domain-containing protein [Dysosmobacter sp.]MCI7281103.1 S-layer homology domain-containing protein [Dysosmobacter sp.]
MKKFLSLVLALVMTMSLVTVSAGAKDFTDSTKIQYTEAVDVMSAVKVIDGYTDGSFNPTATLTRGAAAKIICNLILGPTTASALVADAAPYKDVPTNHTFAGYIAYCQKEGIISGYADGTFKPANSLTGYAFMKMLLGALGYKAEQEGYTGANWSINVAKRALNIGLDDDLVGSFNGVKAVNREEACLYAFNTLKATMVEYEKNSTVTVGNITIKDTSSAKEMTNTGKTDGNIDKDGKMQFAEKYFTDLKEFDSTDDFYRPATQWKIKSEEVGKYTDTADLTYTKKVESGDIYKDLDLGDTIAAKNVSVYVNGEEAAAAEVAIKKGSEDAIGDKTGSKGNGVLTEVFYDKDDDSVVITQIVTYVGEINKTVKATAKKDAYVVLTPETSANGNVSAPVNQNGDRYKNLEFETDEKFDDDTYVLYTYSFKADEVKSVVAAEKVEGYVSKTINKTNDLDQNNGMTIAGTDYKMSKANAGDALGNVSVKNDYTVYLDQYGYIIYVEEIKEIGNYALLLATANKGSFIGDKAQLLLTDGTTKFVTTDENYHSGSKKIVDNTIVTFRENSDGTYTLKAVTKNGGTKENGNNVTSFVMKNDKAGIVIETVSSKDTVVTANSASVFVVADKLTGSAIPASFADIDDWTAYTGIKNAPSVSGGNVKVYYYCKSNSMVTVMFVVPNSNATVEDDAKNSVFFAKESVSDLIHDEDGDYFEYNAIVDGKITTVKVKDTATNAAKLNGLYKNYSTNNKGYVTSTSPYATYTDGDAKEYLTGAGIAKTSKEYTVTLGTTKGPNAVITVDDNAKIYFVDKDGNISESSYKAIYQDVNDKVYAIVEDYLVKTLVIEEVEDKDASSTPTLSDDITVKSVDLYAGTFTYVVESGKLITPTTDDIYAVLANAGCTNITYDSKTTSWSYTMPNGVTVKDHTVTGTQVVDTPKGMTSTKVEEKTTGSDTTPARVVTCTLTDKTLKATALKNFTDGVAEVAFSINGNEMVVADGSTTTIAEIIKAYDGFFMLRDSKGALIEYVVFTA